LNGQLVGGDRAISERRKAMGMIIEKIKETFSMEIRRDCQKPEYFEAVINKKDLRSLKSILKKELGRAAKEPGKEANLPMETQRFVDSSGGLRINQSFFYKKTGNQVIFAALWPWESDPNKTTLRIGVEKFNC
jgi:hypothetical protein